MKQISNDDVISYYKASQWLYAFIWSPKSHGMHIGFWDRKTHSVDQAVDNENEEILKLCKGVKPKNILDAGCGVGGTALYIAKRMDAYVTGISLVDTQVLTAQKLARKANVHHNVNFLQADFTKMPFPDASFDVVYGIESVCHAYPKSAFLKEAFRVLKKGGRLIIADGFLRRSWKNGYEKGLVKSFCSSFALNELSHQSTMKEDILNAGFSKVVWRDRSRVVLQTTKYFYTLYQISYLLLPLMYRLPFLWAKAIYRNAQAGKVALPMWEKGLGCYGIFIAVR